MSLLEDYKKFKEETVGKAFVDDQEFFKKRYNFPLYPFAQDLFKDLVEMKAKLDELTED